VTRLLLLFFILLTSTPIIAQNNASLQDTFYEAEYFLLEGYYTDALPFYQQIYATMPENANIAYRIGLCYLNIEGKKKLSIEYLEKAAGKVSARYHDGSLKQTDAPYEALSALGDAYRVNYMFEKAREAYKSYRNTLLPDETDNLAFIDQQIAACNNAPVIMAQQVKYNIESLGNIINDSKENYFPVISSDGKSIAYMTSMKFYEAIMFSRFIRGNWIPPVNITPELQSDGDHYISCLSVSNGMLLISKDDDVNSDIWIGRFDGVRWEQVTRMKKGINTRYWESHGYITDDGSTLIFASDRPGGFGGLDLYITRIDKSGEWGTPENMGPQINTPLNEDRPFLVDNGKQLFFASQGHYNMGGYDIFHSILQHNGLWSKPENIGYPLNTPDDNIFFCPEENGKGGYISLSGEKDGVGKGDIYKIRFK